MNYIILIIVGIVGIILGAYLGRRRAEKESKPLDETSLDNARDKQGKERLIEKQAQEKEENKRKILEFFEPRERVANNDIEALLGVSDATATRYLDELEKEGLIRQVGKTGRHVYYEKIDGSTELFTRQ